MQVHIVEQPLVILHEDVQRMTHAGQRCQIGGADAAQDVVEDLGREFEQRRHSQVKNTG